MKDKYESVFVLKKMEYVEIGKKLVIIYKMNLFSFF